MKLIDDAGKLWHKFWCIKFNIAAAVFLASGQILAVLQLVSDKLPNNPWALFVFLTLCLICIIGAIGSRLLRQDKLHQDDDCDSTTTS